MTDENQECELGRVPLRWVGDPANGEPTTTVGSTGLVAAETVLSALSELMAEEYQQHGSTWDRDWMQKHSNERQAVCRVRALLIDRAEAATK